MDQRIRKLMTIQKAYILETMKTLYVLRKGGTGLGNIQNCVVASMQKLEDYIKKSAEED